MADQHYKNHARMVPGYHYALLPVLLVALIGSCVYLYRTIQNGESRLASVVLLLLALSVIATAYYARSFALKAQDRAIRIEQQFRYYILTGKHMPSSLRISQIIALRFASDEEFVGLCQRAADEKTKSKEIKKLIRKWKGDYNRV
jgi:hypothetical protein